MDPVSVLVAVGIAKSGNDAKRLVDQGGFRVNGEKAGQGRMLKAGDVISARRRNVLLK